MGLPTFSRAEVSSHNSSKSCYVTIGDKVYDVTDFVDDHPGGADLVLEYAGKDVKEILLDESSHEHSEAAYEILAESLVGIISTDNDTRPEGNGQAKKEIGFVEANGNWVHPRTGMSCEEDLNKETDITTDYQKHKFLDLSRPLFLQIWNGGFSKEFYLDQVHRPRHYKGGESAPLFGNFLEPLSLTPWWLIPILWLPPVAYGTYLASQGLSPLELVGYWLGGLGIWTFLEYCLHRFLFHLDEYVIFPVSRFSVLTHSQLSARQQSRHHPPLHPPRHPPLPPDGQVPTCHATSPVSGSCYAVLEVGALRLLL